MTTKTALRVQHKRMTNSQWASSGDILLDGEIGIEADTGYAKVGDGTSRFDSLKYMQGPIGPQGPQGPKGEPGQDGRVQFEALTAEQQAMLKGPAGDRGPQGEAGPRGERGEVGPQGPVGPIGPEGPRGERGERGQKGVQVTTVYKVLKVLKGILGKEASVARQGLLALRLLPKSLLKLSITVLILKATPRFI